jgi:hypothetical protein
MFAINEEERGLDLPFLHNAIAVLVQITLRRQKTVHQESNTLLQEMNINELNQIGTKLAVHSNV